MKTTDGDDDYERAHTQADSTRPCSRIPPESPLTNPHSAVSVLTASLMRDEMLAQEPDQVATIVKGLLMDLQENGMKVVADVEQTAYIVATGNDFDGMFIRAAFATRELADQHAAEGEHPPERCAEVWEQVLRTALPGHAILHTYHSHSGQWLVKHDPRDVWDFEDHPECEVRWDTPAALQVWGTDHDRVKAAFDELLHKRRVEVCEGHHRHGWGEDWRP
ncbi:hypothetical protein [Sphaerisporangium aureirubrum]|uniref:Uncharacterized protein n=1 Tax=Sphaerisporangium aureirubrum TaxID=1544736 RepID=A0ABW1NC63_9ACTN